MDKEFLRYEEVAKRLNLSPYRLKEWARKGLIPSYRFGDRVVRFRISEVEDWINSKKGFELKDTTLLRPGG